MAYNEPTFLVSFQECVAGTPAAGLSLGTVTASATQVYTGTAGSQVNGTFRFPVFKNPVKLENIRVYCTGAPGSGVTGVFFDFYNANTGGNIVSGTAPAVNTYADFVPSAPVLDSHGVVVTSSTPSYFPANGEVIMVNAAIGTASGSSLGSYAVDFTVRNLFIT